MEQQLQLQALICDSADVITLDSSELVLHGCDHPCHRHWGIPTNQAAVEANTICITQEDPPDDSRDVGAENHPTIYQFMSQPSHDCPKQGWGTKILY